MGAFTSVSVLAGSDAGGIKTRIVTATGPASYDSGGSVIDLSSTGLANAYDGFVLVYGGRCISNEDATDCTYLAEYIAAAAYAPATGKLRISLREQATPAEASGDMSGRVWTFVFYGR